MAKKCVIRLDRVSKSYGRQVALRGVSLEVPEGVVFALLGENGAGKTSMIRVLLGLARADAGTAEVLGLNSDEAGLQIRRATGYVSERPTLYEWMTVDEAGWFAAGFHPDGYLSRFRALTDDFGLNPKDRIRNLSKGMRSKVALSLAMAHDPAVLILDEPTSGLDTMVRREFLESMVDLTAHGRTVFLSSHQIPEVERVADLVAILREGQLVLVESLDQLKQTSSSITVTLADHETPFEVPGAVVHQRRLGRQCELLMRGDPAGSLEVVRRLPLVESVEHRTPSLEDIVVAYMQSGASLDAADLVERPEVRAR